MDFEIKIARGQTEYCVKVFIIIKLLALSMLTGERF